MAETLFKILGGSHGKKEPSGILLCDKLKKAPLTHVEARYAHPTLIKDPQERRYLGTDQIMSRYQEAMGGLVMDQPSYILADPERTAAAENLSWLDDAVGNPEVIVFDAHDSTIPQLTCCFVGKRASKRTLVAAYDLGYRKIIVVPEGSFYNTVPNAAALENSTANETPEAIVERLYNGLQSLSAGVDPQRYSSLQGEMEFYTKVDIRSSEADGSLRAGIEALEAIAAQPAFSALDLSSVSETTRSAFQLPSHCLVETWGHNNMSMHSSSLGHTADGTKRREYFGGCFIKIDPPRPEDEWVVFDSFHSRSKDIE